MFLSLVFWIRRSTECYAYLEYLGVIHYTSLDHYALTRFGEEVRQQGFDLRSSILATICARVNLPWHGRIAAAYIEAQSEVLGRELSFHGGFEDADRAPTGAVMRDTMLNRVGDRVANVRVGPFFDARPGLGLAWAWPVFCTEHTNTISQNPLVLL